MFTNLVDNWILIKEEFHTAKQVQSKQKVHSGLDM